MAKEASKKKSAKEASNIFHSIMKASVAGNPKPKIKVSKMLPTKQEILEILQQSTNSGTTNANVVYTQYSMEEKNNLRNLILELNEDGEIKYVDSLTEEIIII